MAPTMVISQPKIAMLPIPARLAGSINTPDPIIFPATIKVAGTKPILLFSLTIRYLRGLFFQISLQVNCKKRFST